MSRDSKNDFAPAYIATTDFSGDDLKLALAADVANNTDYIDLQNFNGTGYVVAPQGDLAFQIDNAGISTLVADVAVVALTSDNTSTPSMVYTQIANDGAGVMKAYATSGQNLRIGGDFNNAPASGVVELDGVADEKIEVLSGETLVLKNSINDFIELDAGAALNIEGGKNNVADGDGNIVTVTGTRNDKATAAIIGNDVTLTVKNADIGVIGNGTTLTDNGSSHSFIDGSVASIDQTGSNSNALAIDVPASANPAADIEAAAQSAATTLLMSTAEAQSTTAAVTAGLTTAITASVQAAASDFQISTTKPAPAQSDAPAYKYYSNAETGTGYFDDNGARITFTFRDGNAPSFNVNPDTGVVAVSGIATINTKTAISIASGSDITVNAKNTVITAAEGSIVTLHGSGNVIDAGEGAEVNVIGDKNTVVGNSIAANISGGTDNAVMANHSAITFDHDQGVAIGDDNAVTFKNHSSGGVYGDDVATVAQNSSNAVVLGQGDDAIRVASKGSEGAASIVSTNEVPAGSVLAVSVEEAKAAATSITNLLASSKLGLSATMSFISTVTALNGATQAALASTELPGGGIGLSWDSSAVLQNVDFSKIATEIANSGKPSVVLAGLTNGVPADAPIYGPDQQAVAQGLDVSTAYVSAGGGYAEMGGRRSDVTAQYTQSSQHHQFG